MENYFSRGFTSFSEEEKAIEDISHQILKENTQFSLLFFSDKYDAKKLEVYIKKYFGDNVLACSSAGEIAADGYHDNGITGLAFHGEAFRINSFLIQNLRDFNSSHMKRFDTLVHDVRGIQDLSGNCPQTFSLLFVDGLSEKEELVTEIVGSKLGSIPLVGGSSGDGLRFKKTYIYFKGQMLQDVAVVIFVTTYIPFKVFKTQHFNGSEVKFVITESQPEKRLVFEINGEPAAKAYAQAIGVAVEDLNSKIFAKYPLVLKVADSYHVRSIQSSNADFSLKFYCAIENGLVLSLADKNDIIDSTLNYFKNIEEKLQEITCSLLFECVLRRLEVDEMSVEEKRKLYSIYSGINGVGFHTYGEQYGSVHVNQTLTGVVFGPIR